MPYALCHVVLASSLLLATAGTSGAQETQDGVPAPAMRLPSDAMVVPFRLGEFLEYDVKFGVMRVGSGSMEVRDIVDVRGVASWHTIFRFSGGIPFYRVDDKYESWFDTVTLTSRRYFQDIQEGSYKPKRRFEIYAERGVYQKNSEPEQPTVAEPLDEGSFLYFARTIPLDVGKEYTFHRYFQRESNPVRIKVLRRDTIDVPAGRFATIVVRPTFQSKGLFSENGNAEVWLSDDDRRIMVQMKSKLSIGSINLYLRSVSSKLKK